MISFTKLAHNSIFKFHSHASAKPVFTSTFRIAASPPQSCAQPLPPPRPTPYRPYTTNFNFLPQDIVNELDKHIVGQSQAKKCLAIALRERWAKSRIHDQAMRSELAPHNILLIGPTGSGKSELAKRLAAIVQAPFLRVVATNYTEVGFVGDDTNSMIADLAQKAYRTELKRRKNTVAAQARKRALDTLTQLILSEKLVKAPIEVVEASLLHGQYNHLLVPLSAQYLTDLQTHKTRHTNLTQPTLDALHPSNPITNHFVLPAKNIAPPSLARINVKVERAFELLQNHYSINLISPEEVANAARYNTEENGIIFLDEFDKIIQLKDTPEHKSKKLGVQKELLSLMEGSHQKTAIGNINTRNILFIAAGAFSASTPSDIIPELQGRLPISCQLQELTPHDYYLLLTSTKYNPLSQQQALLQAEGIQLTFDDDAIWEIAKLTASINSRYANIGARRLSTVLNTLLADFKFQAHNINGKAVNITKSHVLKTAKDWTEPLNLNRYII